MAATGDRAAGPVLPGGGVLAGEGGYALHCDEYELTMAQSFLAHGQTGRAVFELAVRSLPKHRGYLITAGLETVLGYLEDLHFDHGDLAWLATLGIYGPAFLDHLRGIRFTGDVDAIPEGTPIGAGEPLLRIVAPRIEATLVESALLAIVNHQTLVATKAARVVDAAAGRPVLDFSLRRLHGPDAALGVARAAWIGGVSATATVVAGRRLGIPTTGTMAHHFVLAFGPDREQAAFEQFLRDYPGRAWLLVDTYDTLRGTQRAIAASRVTGVPLAGVRLDSGDLAALSRGARELLDAAGMRGARVVASNDLDEWSIEELLHQGAPIDAFGVGTSLGTSSDAPALGGVYKLVADEDAQTGRLRPVMKRSAGKVTDPGVHQVWRLPDGDVIGLATESLPGEPLLLPVLRGGVRLHEPEPLDAIRERRRVGLLDLPEEVRRLTRPVPLAVRRSLGLEQLHRDLEGGAGGEGAARVVVPAPPDRHRLMEVRRPRRMIDRLPDDTALIAVDVQRDFLPGGALGVPGGNAVVGPLVRAAHAAAFTVATRDLHPVGHVSFVEQGGPWPDHCVAGTPGAAVEPRVLDAADLVVAKGRDESREAYSGFDGTVLAGTLRARGIRRLLIGGLATDYCVRATVLDALREGFEVVVLEDAVRAVDVQEGDGARALDEMRAAGARVLRVADALPQPVR